jgi:hypothetical protein
MVRPGESVRRGVHAPEIAWTPLAQWAPPTAVLRRSSGKCHSSDRVIERLAKACGSSPKPVMIALA